MAYTDPTAGDDANAIQDAAGNDTPSFTTGMDGVPAVTNNSTVETTPPSLVNAKVFSSGLFVQFEFSENLQPANLPPTSAFTVTAGGSAVTVSGIAADITQTIFQITVSPRIRQGQAVVVAYADPTAGDDANAIQDVVGNETPDFTTGSGGVPAVTNNSTVAANNAPVFDPAAVSRSVAENTAAGQNVGAAVTATDADTGDTLTYTLGGTDAASFDIVSSSGQIRTKTGVSYDHEAKASYSVIVTASDGTATATATATATVTISVTDVDEPPAAPAAPGVGAVSGSNTSLAVSWTAPPNAGKPAIATYDVQYRQGTSGNFTDGPQDATGTSATIMSLTAGTLYQVQVRATNADGDSGWSPSGSATTNSATNNAPVFDPSAVSRSVAENTAPGQNVGNPVSATDADTGDTLAYTLGGTDAASFDIVSSSGQIRTKAGVTYDHEAKASYSVTVTASDGTATTDATVTISVTDVDGRCCMNRS